MNHRLLERLLRCDFVRHGGRPEDTTSRFLEEIKRHLEEHPDDIDLLLPGWRLKKPAATRKERAQKTLPKANAARARAKEEFDRTVGPQILEVRRRNPAISLRALCELLDEERIRPPRSDTWHPSSLAQVLRRLEKRI